MGRGIPWLDFSSSREKRKREERYYRAMFPFGEAQRERERELLIRCTDARLGAEELLYQLLCVREALQDEDEESREEALDNWKRSRIAAKLSEADRRVVYALAAMPMSCSGLEEYPDEDTLKQKAEKISLE